MNHNLPMLKEKDTSQKPWLHLPVYIRICQDGECDIFVPRCSPVECAQCVWVAGLGSFLNDTEATTVGYGTLFAGNGLYSD